MATTQAGRPGGATTPNLEATIVPDKTHAGDLDATSIGGEPSAAAKPVAVAVVDSQVMGGDFEIIQLLGKGGMGEVYLAHQKSLDRKVALKVMHPQFCTQETFAKRFVREAQTMAKLDHPNIVRGYAVGDENGRLYLAMELIKGKSMQDWMGKIGKMSVGDALHVTLLVADALKHAHELNLIHRDIKPDNILITDKGVVKVSDMGLAKATDEDMSMTQSGTGLGTPYYMPPEQARNAKHVDNRSDIYALGCTLYYFLSGKLPFSGTSAAELIMAKEKGQFPRLRSHNHEVPERLELIVDKMIQKDPKHRYQSCDDLIRDLSALGLASPGLSFSEAAAPGAARLPTPLAATTGASAMSKTPASVKPAAAGTSAVAPAKPEKQEHVWFVIVTQPQGPPKKVKLTTGQIMAQLKSGTLDPKCKATQDAKGEFKPLAMYREFDHVLRERTAQKQADEKTKKYEQLYKQIDRQQRWYPWVKWFRRQVDNVKGIISLIVYLAVLAGIGFGAWYYWPTIMQLIRSRTGS